jgi:hypothetical protein
MCIGRLPLVGGGPNLGTWIAIDGYLGNGEILLWSEFEIDYPPEEAVEKANDYQLPSKDQNAEVDSGIDLFLLKAVCWLHPNSSKKSAYKLEKY